MRISKKLHLVVLVIIISLSLSFLLLHQYQLDEDIDMTFYEDSFNWECEPGTKFLRTLDSLVCLPDDTIFFLESSDSRLLNSRQACSVESAALHHSNRQVRVLMTSPQPLDLSDPFMEALTNLTNVRLLRVDIGFLVFGTPLWHWYIKGKWKTSKYRTVHRSDATRLSIIWKYGGLYLDLDVVVLQNLSHLHNTTTTDNGKNVATAFLAFDAFHPLFRAVIMDYAANYDPNEFAANGPLLLNKNFKKHCKVDDVYEFHQLGGVMCDVDVLPQAAAYPIPYQKWWDYFKPQSVHNMTVFDESVVIHVWNALSKGRKLKIGQNSLYEMAMKSHCPTVYKVAQGIGYA